MLVSCIMPTANRRAFVAQAIKYFSRQTYPERELVIIDDGEESVEDLVHGEEDVRYVRLAHRQSIGAKRNLACEIAGGDFIAHWDDDDWIGCARLEDQVRLLRDSGSAAVGAPDLLYYAPLAGQAWRYTRQAGHEPGVCGGTLLYRKALWQEYPYQDVSCGEDEAFVRSLPVDRVRLAPADGYYIGILHGGNTAPKSLRPPRWSRSDLDDVVQHLWEDRDFYVGLRNGFPPARVPAASTGLTLIAPFIVYDGYGSMAEYLALGLAREGIDVRPVPLGLDLAGLTPAMQSLLSGPKPASTDPILFFSYPQAALTDSAGNSELFVSTMWEADRLPPGWADALNRARAVIVPSRFLVGVLRDSGVTRPVEVVPQGIDPQIYTPITRPERDTFTTLIVGTVIGRKHVREGIAAWQRAFGGDPRARLVIKSRFQYGNYVPDDPRIRFEDANLAQRGISSFYAEADVLLALGNEGFGLPLVEGMATGLPVIALDAEGQADICADANGLVLPVPSARREPCDDTPFGPGGLRAVPDDDDRIWFGQDLQTGGEVRRFTDDRLFLRRSCANQIADDH
jgi:glycosyltransferase involved in cell wall biosynthesis